MSKVCQELIHNGNRKQGEWRQKYKLGDFPSHDVYISRPEWKLFQLLYTCKHNKQRALPRLTKKWAHRGRFFPAYLRVLLYKTTDLSSLLFGSWHLLHKMLLCQVPPKTPGKLHDSIKKNGLNKTSLEPHIRRAHQLRLLQKTSISGNMVSSQTCTSCQRGEKQGSEKYRFTPWEVRDWNPALWLVTKQN